VWALRRSPFHDRRVPQELFAIDHRPTDPNIFAVAGNSACVSMYDFRALSPQTNRNASQVKYASASTPEQLGGLQMLSVAGSPCTRG